MATSNFLNPTKTSIFAVCITRNTPFRQKSVEAAIAAFDAQDYPGPRRMLIVGDKTLPVFVKHKKTTKLHCLHVPDNVYSLGELRNLAKTYVGILCSREKRTHHVVHWDDDDFSHPDRLTLQVAATPLHGVSTMYRTVRYSFQNNFALTGGDGLYGDLGTLMYPASVPVCFTKSPQNIAEKFAKSLAKAETPVHTVLIDPAMCVRTHQADSVTSYTKFIANNQSTRHMTSAEQLYLQFVLGKSFGFVKSKFG